MFGFFDWLNGGLLAVQTADADRIRHLEKKLEEARLLLEEIVCVKDPDKGVILVSSNSSASWCDHAQAWIYENEHFSPLGDALIKLHEKLIEGSCDDSRRRRG